jgi:hypothetical protein
MMASSPLNAKADKQYKAPKNAPAYAELYERGDGYKIVVKKTRTVDPALRNDEYF